MSALKMYAYAWVTAAAFLFCLLMHFVTGWWAGESTMKLVNAFWENMTSEMGQIIWQAGGPILFYWIGSTLSREQSERMEAKIDALMERNGLTYQREMLDEKFYKKE
jgi:hypothetical protein